MTHLLVAGKLHPVGVARLEAMRAEGVTVTYIEEISEESYADHIVTADALVIRTQPLSAATIARADRLKVVSRHGVGYDSVDVDALNARGIPLAIVDDVNSVSVAEHAMMQLLAGADALMSLSGHRRQQVWDASALRSTPLLLRDAPIDEAFLELPEAPEGEEIVFDLSLIHI